jgi:hypothetical protein
MRERERERERHINGGRALGAERAAAVAAAATLLHSHGEFPSL